MPVLSPFRAFTHPRLAAAFFIPGEEPPPPIDHSVLIQDPAAALFLYRQQFVFPGDTQPFVRAGIMGLLDRSASIYPHEHTLPGKPFIQNGLQSSSLFLWCNDDTQALNPLLNIAQPPDLEVRDRSGCLHQIWRIADPSLIRQWQAALAAKDLFLADGHHRFAAGWTLATIQIRTPALQTLAAHRLVMQDYTFPSHITHPISDIASFLNAPSRFILVRRGPRLSGFELALAPGERNLSALHSRLLSGVATQPVRGTQQALHAVASGAAKLAFLVQPLSVSDIQEDARQGRLLPPKSTDFFPKLAGGLVMHRTF